jgi:hypothetical protein
LKRVLCVIFVVLSLVALSAGALAEQSPFNLTVKRQLGEESPLLDNSIELGIALNETTDLVAGASVSFTDFEGYEDFEIFSSLGARHKFLQRDAFNAYVYGSLGVGYRTNEFYTAHYTRKKLGLGLNYDLSENLALAGEAGARVASYEGPLEVTKVASDAAVGLRYYF